MAFDIKTIAFVAVAWFITTAFIAPFLGIAAAGLSGIFLTLGLLYIVKYAGFLNVDLFGLSKPLSLYVGIGLIVITVGIGTVVAGITGLAGGLGSGAVAASVTSTQAAASLDACTSSVSAETRGLASTIDINAYDYANDSQASAVDVTNTHIFEASSTGFADGMGFKSTLTDTSGSTINAAIGKTYTIAGGDASYYLDPLNGFCATNARPSVVLRAYAAVADTNLVVTAYDQTGSAALSAGGSMGNSDYQMSLGASAIKAIEVKWEVGAANKAYQLAAIGTLVGENLTSVKPDGNSAGLFTAVATPQHMKDQAITYNTSQTLTRSYTVYKLNTPILLKEWQFQQFRFSVEASANDPVAAEAGSALVALQAKDATWVKGGDGKLYFDIHDHSSSENDVGVAEVETSPQGKTSGVLIEID